MPGQKDWGVEYLDEDAGSQLHVGDDGLAKRVEVAEADPFSRLAAIEASRGVHPAAQPGLGGTAPVHAAMASRRPSGPRALTPEELMAAAEAMHKQMSEEHDARMKAGPAVGTQLNKVDKYDPGY